MQKLRQSGTIIGFVLIIAFFSFQLPDTFLTARKLLHISQQLSRLAVVAVTMTIVMMILQMIAKKIVLKFGEVAIYVVVRIVRR